MIRFLPITPVGNMLFGATALALGTTLLRPALVGVVRAGLSTKDYAQSVWASAKAEAKEIQAEAASGRVHSLESELIALRAELEQLKASKKA